jgi:uncharacterized membrane protein (DUF4010 family)
MEFDVPASSDLRIAVSFATSLAIGLMMGLERERHPEAMAGLRTFALTALLGSLCALLADEFGAGWILAAGLLAVGATIGYAQLRNAAAAPADPGTTTVVALLVCYMLGAVVWAGYPSLAVMAGLAATLLLTFKAELSGIARGLERRDLISMLQFLVVTFIVLPLLPDADYGPYGALNPYNIWLMVVLISGISLAGYIAMRRLGDRRSVVLLGIFGGLVSSTATTLVQARQARAVPEPGAVPILVILFANLVLLARVAVLTAIVSPSMLATVLPVLAGGLVAGAVPALYWWRKLGTSEVLAAPAVSNPTEFRTAFGFAGFYAVVLVLAAWLADIAGDRGLYLASVVSGLTDVDAITLSTLRLEGMEQVAPAAAVGAITLAITANAAFKAGIAAFAGGGVLGRRCAAGLACTVAGLGLALLLTMR